MALDINYNEELVIDPYRHKERYLSWDKKLEGISQANETAIITYLEDIRRGLNINPKARKGKRGYQRLNSQRHRLKRICELLEANFKIIDIAPRDMEQAEALRKAIFELFDRMEEGVITKLSGKRYRGTKDYIKGFKAFWHWHMVYMKNKGNIAIPDICEYLTIKENRKPKFVYFGDTGGRSTEEGFRKLYSHAKHNYKALMAFLFDSGIRSPTELMNVKRKDLLRIKDSPYTVLHIRDETSKTFGRKIKLMLCNEILWEHIEENGIQHDEFIFKINPRVANQYLKRLGERVLGKKGITMYDFRHNSACYWAPRYKNPNSLLSRFGWKNLKMLHYYTDFLGMKDTIDEEDLILDKDMKTRIECDLNKEKSKLAMMEEQLDFLRQKMEENQRKDEFLNRLIAGMIEKGLGNEMVDLIKAEGLEQDLLKLKENHKALISFEVEGNL